MFKIAYSLAQLSALANTLTSTVKSNVEKAVNNAKAAVSSVVNTVSKVVNNTANAAAQLASDAAKKAAEAVKNATNTAKDIIDNTTDAIIDNAKTAVDTANDYYNVASGQAGKYSISVVADVAGFTKAVNDLIQANNNTVIKSVENNVLALQKSVGEEIGEARKDFLSTVSDTLASTTEQLAESFNVVRNALLLLPVVASNYFIVQGFKFTEKMLMSMLKNVNEEFNEYMLTPEKLNVIRQQEGTQ